MCGWCKCWLIILAPSNPLVQGRWASCGSLMEEVPLPSGNALGTSGLSCCWHFTTISFLVTWVGSPLQGLLGIQFFRGLLCVVKEQRKKISTLNVTLSLSVSLSISFGMELCWGLADNCFHCWAMWSISLRWWSNLDWFTTGGEFNSLCFPSLEMAFSGRELISKVGESNPLPFEQAKTIWWCLLPSSKILLMMSLHGITRWWLFVSPPTKESSSVVHLHHYKHSRHCL